MDFIGISYAGRGIYVKKPDTWDGFLQTVSQRFGLSTTVVTSLRVLYSDYMSSISPRLEIDASAWPGVGPKSTLYLEVDKGTQNNDGRQAASTSSMDTAPVYTHGPGFVKLFINLTRFGKEEIEAFEVAENSKFEDILANLSRKYARHLVLAYEGQRVNPSDTPILWEMVDCVELVCAPDLVVAKPAVYLLSPRPLQSVLVSVSLCPRWDFTAIYPITPKITHAHTATSDVTWVVSVQADGTIVNQRSGRQSSYLSWEASSGPGFGSATANMPQLSRAMGRGPAFDPANPEAFLSELCTNATLPFEKFEPYLDSALEGLTLTPAMRTEFIVYWLPSFQRIRDQGKNIQFTFVPQDVFNQAAALTVTVCGAHPKAVARVFMLFRGVKPGQQRDSDPPKSAYEISWPHIIGLDVDAMKDESAFRVLEWGAMEVL